jgi:hypothetical protein
MATKKKTNKGKKYKKPVSLYPMKFEQALKILVSADKGKYKS